MTPGRAVTASLVRALQSIPWLCTLCITDAATQTGAAPSVYLPTCRSVERKNLGRNQREREKELFNCPVVWSEGRIEGVMFVVAPGQKAKAFHSLDMGCILETLF